MGKVMKIARRGFLFGSVAILGGVAFGWWKYETPYGNPLEGGEGATLNPYVLIDAQGITIIAPRAEMGQGVQTTLAALVAEEMDLTLDQVRVIHGPASAAYYNSAILGEGVPFAPTDFGRVAEAVRAAMEVPAKFLGLQMTGGSSSVPDAYDKMRVAGAAARAALVQAAALRLGVAAEALRTEGGAVVAPDGTKLTYVELAEAAAGIELDAEPVLKAPAAWTVLGKSQARVDVVAKSTGTAVYTADLRLPGMLFASARTNPRLGGAVKGYDASAAEAMAGVVKVVPVPGGAAVVAQTTWTAMQAVEAIAFDWGEAPYPATSAEIATAMAFNFTQEFRDSVNRDDGDVETALAAGDVFEAAYTVPYLAHATMEPMTAAALLKDGKLTIWAGNQFPTQAQAEGAALTGLPAEAVTVETLAMGGGFGRRAEMDIIRQAVTLAMAVEGKPVLLTWSREEDMTHDGYRPAALGQVRAKLEGGRIAAFDFGTCSSSVIESQGGRLGFSVPGPDGAIVQGAWEQPYRFAHHRVTGYRAPAMVPVGSWRSVGASQNAFFHESAVDELAHLAGADPVQFRLDHIDHGPSREVISAVAKLADWGRVAAGRAKGFAFCMSFGVPVAEVVEVEQGPSGIRITGAWAAVDVGVALDPRNIEAQVTGAMVYGLSAAVRGEITFADGMAEQRTFWDYEPLRMPQVPPMQVVVLQNLERIRGIGEPGLPPVAPALANAIFALTGQRLRGLPLAKAVAFA